MDGGCVKRKSTVDTVSTKKKYILIKGKIIYNETICEDGGIGRHERLKISWLHGRAGSSPALRTNIYCKTPVTTGVLLYTKSTRNKEY